MSALVIHNASRNEVVFGYRLPGTAAARSVTILPGATATIAGLSRTEVDAVVEQHRTYGLVAAAEVGAGFSGLSYTLSDAA